MLDSLSLSLSLCALFSASLSAVLSHTLSLSVANLHACVLVGSTWRGVGCIAGLDFYAFIA